MIVEIKDDFDLEKIRNSGQSFRVEKFDDLYRFVSKDKILYIKRLEKDQYEVSCSKEDWETFWTEYFDLNTNYSEIRKKYKGTNKFIDEALEYSKGIRILKQDPLEILFTFILAQQKSLGSIRKIINEISRRYGKKVTTEIEDVYLFPALEELCKMDELELRELKLGYRTPYFLHALELLSSNTINLKELTDLSDDELKGTLKKIKGIGDKVASCIALYSYNRKRSIPIDVWIKRAIENEFNGENLFEEFGDEAGIIQQYVFDYMRNN